MEHPSEPRSQHDVEPDTDLWVTGPVWSRSERRSARLLARPAREFMRVESSGSVLLLLAALAALVWANSPWEESYTSLWQTPVTIGFGDAALTESLQHWVNDALMVIFFFVVGMEIKYELVHGDLKDPRQAALPMIAAAGGMAVPALIYAAFNLGTPGAAGWGIPMATDIAFAVGVLGLLGRRIPSGARLFLLTLAVVDDIGAILVIAVFYTADLAIAWLLLAISGLVIVFLMKKVRIWNRWAYIVAGLLIWFALLQSGVHATLAGVALGLLTPATALLHEAVARQYVVRALQDNRLDPDEIARLKFLMDESVPTVGLLQARLHPLSAYVVLPVFALANAGVALSGGALAAALDSGVAVGIAVGLFVGKPIGIFLFTWVAVRLGFGALPQGTTWPMVVGLGFVAGIGFTVSLFIAGLSFPGAMELTDAAKIGIIVGSLLSAVVGFVMLRLVAGQPENDQPAE